MSEPGYLPDVNVLVALSDPSHINHQEANNWNKRIGKARFILCPITEAGFVRLMANPSVGALTMIEALLLLKEIAALPNYENLPVAPSWWDLVFPFASRLHGYRQVTDALLLGLAIRNGAVLVTLDRSIKALAGEAYADHLLTLV